MVQATVNIYRRGRVSRAMIVLLGCAVALTMVIGCEAKAPPKVPPPPVDVAAVKQMDMPVDYITTGLVSPLKSVSLRAQVGSYVVGTPVEEGQLVQEGQTVFQLDLRTFDANANVAAGTLEQTKAQLVNAELQLKRGEELLKQKYMSQQDYDSLQAQADSLRAGVQAMTASLARAQLDRVFTTIRAPFTGRLGLLLVHKGDLVKVNDTALATLNQTKPIDVQFSVPEKHLPIVRAAMAKGDVPPVQAKAPGPTGGVVTGKLNFIDNQVNAATGSVLLKGRFSNDNETLWPGQYVETTLQLGVQHNALVIPRQAVQTGQLGEYVWLLNGEFKAEIRQVKTGPSRNDLTIIDDGLKAGETVVVDGQIRLAPGVKAEVRKQITVGEPTS